MRAYLIEHLRELVERGQIPRHHAQDVLELYDDECDDTSESTAYDKAMQDIDNIVAGEWDL
tara:strand:+ start:169 stop:351 length:183 start_codon:yes stop_codon:yes gene_type:complete